MEKLDISYDEALEVYDSDKMIEAGADPFKLTAEQEKVSKAMRSSSSKLEKTAVDAYGRKTTKQKKVKVDKVEIINFLRSAVVENGGEILEVENPERIFSFTLNGTKYKLTLSEPRK